MECVKVPLPLTMADVTDLPSDKEARFQAYSPCP